MNRNLDTSQQLAAGIGFTGISLIGFDASPFGPAPMAIGQVLLLLGLPLLLTGRLLKKPLPVGLIGLIAILGIWVLIRWLTDLTGPPVPGLQFEAGAGWDHFRVSGVIALLIGVWIAAFPRAGLIGMGGMLGGMVVYQGINIPPDYVAQMLTGHQPPRLKANTASPNSMGLFCVVTVLAGIILVGSGLREFHAHRSRRWVILQPIGAILVSTNLILLIATQSRAAWVVGATLTPLALAFVLWDLGRKRSISGQNLALIVGSIGLILTAGVASYWDVIAARWGEEVETIHALLTLQPDEIERHSLGKRWFMWTDGVRNIGEYPFWGWGPGYLSATRSNLVSDLKLGGGHYHNIYITFAVSMGVVWTLLWTFMYAFLIVQGGRILRRYGLGEPGVAVGLIIVLAVLINGLATYRFNNAETAGLFLFGSSLLIGAVLRYSPGEPFFGSLSGSQRQPANPPT